MKFPLFARLPRFEELSNDLILDRFLDYANEKKFELYPAQEEAILDLIDGKNVILNTPTGSGKSLVATALHFHSLSMGKKSYYTCPIKALVNEKFLHLCREFGPEQVGMVTGDGSVNRDAPIICCTAEILANIALHLGDKAQVDDVVMDEFHYYSDRERGVAWQIPLLSMPQTRFLLMSATLGEMDFFQKKLTELNQRETSVISRVERPVPLNYEYRETPLHETLKDLISQNASPVYLVNFTQREAAEEAQNLMSVDFTTKEAKKAILERIQGVDFSSPYGKEVQKFLKHGVGVHHAGLLPKYRVLVEKLAQEGLLRVISGTDTLGVGVNVPIRTVLFTKLCKYDGEKTGILSNRDFHQIAGRAGRKGFDDSGRVVAQAPEHVIENLKLEAKAKADPKKAKKIVKAKPPEKGFVMWSQDTFNRLVKSLPEPLQSRFSISHGMLLSVLSRDEDGCLAMRELIRHSHDPDGAKKKHRKLAFTLFRALLNRKLVEIIPVNERPPLSPGSRSQKTVRVNVSLQDDFSLNQSLALWLIDTLNLLDPESETYALDVLTLVEAILESPDLILRKQLDRVKTARMREMKEMGMEYEERMEELEKCEAPKPLREFIYTTFNEFSDKHPWVGTENIRPKSIAREMVETFQSFGEYVREYELQRAEGLLLRYLSDVYRALSQTVPDTVKNDEIDSITEYFGGIIRSVDSSLVDEWERLKHPEREVGWSRRQDAPTLEIKRDFFTDQKKARIRTMNEVFKFLRLLAIGQFEEAVDALRAFQPAGETSAGQAPADGDGEAWTIERLEELARAYGESGHKGLRTDPVARGAKNTRITMGESGWIVEQTMVDPEDLNDWELRFELIGSATKGEDRPVLRLLAIQAIGS